MTQTVTTKTPDIAEALSLMGERGAEFDVSQLQKMAEMAITAGDKIIMPFFENKENVPDDAKAIADWAKKIIPVEELGLSDAEMEMLGGVRDLKEEYEDLPLSSQVQTVADITSELFIKKQLARDFPDVFVVGEESAGQAAEAAQHRHKFYVDPLDGTKEFIDGRSHFGVLIGEAKDKAAQTGVCYFPHAERRELYVGDAAQGFALYGKQQENGQWEFTLYRAQDVVKGSKESEGVVVNETYPEEDSRVAKLAENWQQAEVESTRPAAATILNAAREGKLHMRHDDKAFYWDLAAPGAIVKGMGATFTGLGGVADYSFDEAARAGKDDAFPKAQGYMMTPPGVEPIKSLAIPARQAGQSTGR